MSMHNWIFNNRHYIGKLLIISLIVFPAIITLIFIVRNGINAVMGDSWFFIQLFDKLYSGNLTIADLFAQANEHRIFVPRIIMLTLGTLTQYNIKFEMYFSWALTCLSAFVLYKIFRITPALSRMPIAWFIPVTWLIFSLRSFDNFLTGDHMVYFLVVLCFLLSVYFLQTCKGVDWRLGAAIISAIAGSLTLANDLLIWPIGFIQLLLISRSKTNNQKRAYIIANIIWIMMGIITYIAYFATFQNTEHFVQQPLDSFVYWLAALGNSFYSYPYGAIAVGSILLILFIYAGITILYDSKNRPDNLPFLALMIYSGTTAIMLVLGRPEFSVLSRKYIIIVMVGVIGLYFALLSLKLKFVNPNSLIFKSLIIIMVIFLLVEDRDLFNGISTTRIALDRQLIPYYSATYQFQSDETLTKAGCIPQAVRQGCKVLSDYKLNVFSQPILSISDLKQAERETTCIIESVNGDPIKEGEAYIINDTEKVKTIIITGWAIDNDSGKAAGGILLDIDGKTEMPAYYGISRQDIVEYNNNRNYLYSGFYSSMATSVMGPGRHIVTFKIISADKKEYYQAAKSITVEIR